MTRWTKADLDAHQKRRQRQQVPAGATNATGTGKRAKYGNTAVLVTFGQAGELVSGHVRLEHRFDSAKEAQHYRELCLRRQAGEITNLRLQEAFPLFVNHHKVCVFIADFVYDERKDGKGEWQMVVADVKSSFTREIALYRVKFKLMQAVLGITVLEVV